MATEKTNIFTRITRDHFNTLRKELTTAGIYVPEGDNIALIDTKSHGVRFGPVIYDEKAQTLTVTIQHEGLFVSDSKVWSKLKEWGIK
jgi:hypothetical protein